MKSELTATLLEAEIALLGQLEELRRQIYQSQQDDCGLHVGDLVQYKSYRSVVGIYKVARLSFYNCSKPSVEGFKRKKDGSFSIVPNYIGSTWEPYIEQQALVIK